jgi:hypothetical protein
MYSLVQETDRVDRNPLEIHGDNRYEVHISFNCYVQLFVRIMQHPHNSEQERQLSSLKEVLVLLVTPKECQHIAMEKWFIHTESAAAREPCLTKCTYCTGVCKLFTGRINRDKLTRLLITFFTRGQRPPADLMKFIKAKMNEIFHRRDTWSSMGPTHALCMQLTANGIIELSIAEDKKHEIGTDGKIPHSVIV